MDLGAREPPTLEEVGQRLTLGNYAETIAFQPVDPLQGT